ncbi:MAG TPA: ATP-binding protein [Acidobacteriaceae bacterium]|nr:ATP-binding protein [Acidobacteriaceae bacterium]
MIHHKKRPILYVDDTVEQRYAMRRILETEGFDVLEAGTGKEALKLMERDPALAVVDVRLPDISGYELSRQMKEMSPHLQVLQVSASFSDPELRVSGLSGGADAYLAQPVYPSELVTLIRRMLRTADAEEALRFLATIGTRLSESLSISDTATNICEAIVPRFADRCRIFLEKSPGRAASYFPIGKRDDEDLIAAMKPHSAITTVCMANSRLLVAPLSSGTRSIGLIAFQLDQDREYTESDLILADDLANRAALALQNCILFSSEQLTRSALVQSEKLATAGRMAAAIAHEINNPLEALTNLLYIVESSNGATESIRETAGAALAEVTRIAHITRQTLSFYRDMRTPMTLNLSQSVSDTLQLYIRRFTDKRIAIELKLDEKVQIKGVKGEIRQVVANLLTNAVEAMEPDGNMQLAVFEDQQDAVLSVSDSGPGISEELIGKIFEPFFTTKQGTGTGLGLWITQTIVEKHGGKIRVSTKRGITDHGASFEVRFAKA